MSNCRNILNVKTGKKRTSACTTSTSFFEFLEGVSRSIECKIETDEKWQISEEAEKQ